MREKQQIKLVIWDLDDTFWKGTLLEGEIELIPENIRIVKELTRKGIINSICSKNDMQAATSRIKESGVSEMFVFPHISWNAKGESVKQIIRQCQLRPDNVLFIDDNRTNLQEVEFYNPGIQTMDAMNIPTLLGDSRLTGKDDPGLSRLLQYKILEKKAEFQACCTDNRDFLKKSDIRVKIIRDTQPIEERIIELANRSNQLNYTKIRIQDGERMPRGEDWDTAAIHVMDDFGDYGVSGYYAFNRRTRTLKHFFFSCRILHLGVENFMYRYIGCPSIDIVGEVATPLDPHQVVDWIRIDNFESAGYGFSEKKARQHIMLIGGCDLDLLHHYIDKSKFDVFCDFNHINKRNHSIIHNHTRYIELGTRWNEQIAGEYRPISWWDEEMMDFPCLNRTCDIVVYSTLQNIRSNQFRNRRTGNYLMASKDVLSKNNIKSYTVEDIRYIRDNYDFIGLETPEEFHAQLDVLRRLIPAKKYIFLNIAEIAEAPDVNAELLEHYKQMNRSLEKYVSMNSGICSLVDVRKYVKTVQDITDSISHYRRLIYTQLAEEVMKCCGADIKHSEIRNQIESLLKHTSVKLWLRTGGIRRKIKKILSWIIYSPK